MDEKKMEGDQEDVMATKDDQVQIVNHIKGLLNDIVSQEDGLKEDDLNRVEVLNKVTEEKVNLEPVEVVATTQSDPVPVSNDLEENKEDMDETNTEQVMKDATVKDEMMKDAMDEMEKDATKDAVEAIAGNEEIVGNVNDQQDDVANGEEPDEAISEDTKQEVEKPDETRQAVVTTTTTTTTTTRRTTTTTRRTTTTTQAPGILQSLGNFVGRIGGNLGGSLLTGTSFLAAASTPLWAPLILNGKRRKRDLSFQGHPQLENEILDFEAKILKHARNPEDADILESIVHQVVEGVLNQHKLDKNDVAIKSQIISEVSVRLRRYERELEKRNLVGKVHDNKPEFFSDSIIRQIFEDIKSLFKQF